ncbi:MAG: FlgD immunoglobulin-like domain containing protein [Candidatus Eisenbacteria bacterium]|nr:FlgD immunoglobulin-like domain containing protein [Candidatus Eisenbacteria bacterium]
MKPASSLPAFLVLAVIVATSFLFVGTVAAQQPFEVLTTLTYLGGTPGNQLYKYDYKVVNNSLFPVIAGVLMFFDSDGVNFLGDRADFVSAESPASWDVGVYADPDPNPWFVEWMDPEYANPIPMGGFLEGFSLTIVWKDPLTVPDVQHCEVMNGGAEGGWTEIVARIGFLGNILGTVTATCGSSTVPAAGVTVDLFDSLDNMIASTVTDELGQFSFVELEPGTYHLTIVAPIGYVPDAHTKTVVVNTGETVNAAFTLTCLPIKPDQRTIGYWKHQVNVYLTGKGKAQESLSSLSNYMEMIRIHFNENIYNPVVVFVVSTPGSRADSLEALTQLLTINKGGTMLDRAKQQFIALLLNVASLKLSQSTVISADGATVSQAITYANALIADGLTFNDEIAKDIADRTNNGLVVPAGVIPLSTPTILYELKPGTLEITRIPDGLALSVGYPNPFAERISFTVAIPEGFGTVRMRVFDAKGGLVSTVADGNIASGTHTFYWNGRHDSGQMAASGTYFVKVESGGKVLAGKLILSR